MLLSRISYAHNSIVLNEHIAADGSIDASKLRDTILVDERIRDPTYRDTRDILHLAQGGSLGSVNKGLSYWQLRGRILVPHTDRVADLEARELELRAAFDPYLCDVDSPSTDGAYALDWYRPTTGGLVHVQQWVRPVNQPRVTEALSDYTTRLFAIGLVAADPRIYAFAQSSLSLTPGSASGAVDNIGNTRAPLRAVITMTGAGSSAFTITRNGLPFVLNLSGTVNTEVITVTFETSAPFGRGRRVVKNGTDTFSLKTSGTSSWLDVPIGSTTFSITNTTNVASCALAWYSAWA